MLRQLFFDLQYRFSKPPWDSGVTPPEVTAFVESATARGRALDLGCGTGTNAIYLARRGFTVVGVDFSPKAIANARVKAKRANLSIDFRVVDVTRLNSLGVHEPFDFVLDIGCFHAIDPTNRARYADGIARLTRPSSKFMLYAFSPRPPDHQGDLGQRAHLIQLRNVGITPDDALKIFAPHFTLERIEHGMNRGERASAWFWFRRKSEI
ncbi:cobalt-precorrin-6B (C15)-methyltransferase [Anaerolineae bacterium]|nr:cobalt-precorrin-6B (C15)-methyltransferase [Anaerolineae bacterium]